MKKAEKFTEVQVEISGLTFDRGYGDWAADLQFDAKVFEDGRVETKDHALFFIDSDGGVFDEEEDFEPAADMIPMMEEEARKEVARLQAKAAAKSQTPV